MGGGSSANAARVTEDTGVWAAALPSLQVAASRQATSVSPWTGRVGVGVGCFIHFEAMILDEFEFKF